MCEIFKTDFFLLQYNNKAQASDLVVVQVLQATNKCMDYTWVHVINYHTM